MKERKSPLVFAVVNAVEEVPVVSNPVEAKLSAVAAAVRPLPRVSVTPEMEPDTMAGLLEAWLPGEPAKSHAARLTA